MSLVGALRIELSLHEPESCVLPVYYAPLFDQTGHQEGDQFPHHSNKNSLHQEG